MDELVFVLAFALLLALISIPLDTTIQQVGSSYDYVVRKGIGMRSPHVGSRMLHKCFLGLGSTELKRTLGIWTKSHTSPNLSKGRCRLVDVDIDMRVFQETNGQG